ncbi:TMEM143 family protein [Catelliglobosispora koreensis]|uniref:TMEM143 family protein n=1 Tax=Catelliglobosispora koreensis TaxID=129052 RepID=UPI000371661D|nr:TMEM143 family protein [Catelliglobosispora koreensis]
MRGEHFIPFRKTDIVAMCAEESGDRDAFLGFASMLSSVLHHRFHERIEALKDAYHPFNPEADTRTVKPLTDDERAAARQRLEAELAALAKAANYIEGDAAEIDRAFTEHSLLKVRLTANLDAVDRLMFFRRGERTVTREIPFLFGFRKRTVTLIEYARVLVYATFKDASHFEGTDVDRLPFRPGSTIIKLFQNVPRDDLEMVFPNVQVRMRRIDKWLIGVPALVSGIFMIATKLITSFGLLLLLVAFWFGLRREPVPIDQTSLLSLGIGLAAIGAYLVRQISNFKNRKILFMKALSENLYFRNLDNDAGVFHHLLDAAEEAEVSEAVLAYHFLRKSPDPLVVAGLDRQIEQWFSARWDAQVDFEVEDGLRKLRQLGLVSEDPEGRLTAISLTEARMRLGKVFSEVAEVHLPAQRTGQAVLQ